MSLQASTSQTVGPFFDIGLRRFCCADLTAPDISGEKIGGAGTITEADETYIGGKPRKPAGPSRGTGEPKRRGGGRSTRHRTPVVALVERGGRAVARPTIDATAETLSSILHANVDLRGKLMTDAWRGYITVGREFEEGHERVDHGSGEYVRGSAHVNEAELLCLAETGNRRLVPSRLC